MVNGSGERRGAAQVALVAGATGPIGSEIVGQLGEAGFSVAMVCRRNVDQAKRLRAQLHSPSAAASVDLHDRSACKGLLEFICNELGAPPSVIVNACHLNTPQVQIIDAAADFATSVQRNVTVAINLMSTFVPPMIEESYGRYVFISGALASRPGHRLGAMSAAKSACESLTRTMALEVGAHGITANNVAPGRVDGWTDEEADDAYARLERRASARRVLPRLPTPADVAHVVGFLCSAHSGAITGETVLVNSGEGLG